MAGGADFRQQDFSYSFQALLCRKQLWSWHGAPKVLPPVPSINLCSSSLAEVRSQPPAWLGVSQAEPLSSSGRLKGPSGISEPGRKELQGSSLIRNHTGKFQCLLAGFFPWMRKQLPLN